MGFNNKSLTVHCKLKETHAPVSTKIAQLVRTSLLTTQTRVVVNILMFHLISKAVHLREVLVQFLLVAITQLLWLRTDLLLYNLSLFVQKMYKGTNLSSLLYFMFVI